MNGVGSQQTGQKQNKIGQEAGPRNPAHGSCVMGLWGRGVHEVTGLGALRSWGHEVMGPWGNEVMGSWGHEVMEPWGNVWKRGP